MQDQPRTISVFYAWQSDLPEKFNKHAIRQALTRATSTLMQEASSGGQVLNLVVDDATRKMVGSESITDSIKKKILAADFFVGDVSSIHADQSLPRKKTPNPNVVFELGFAAATLGWSRILMLINTALGGSPDDMPFDFAQHRAATYAFRDGQGAQQALNSLVLQALSQMVEEDAPRPPAKFDQAEAWNKRDLGNLRWFLQAIHLPTLDDHIRLQLRG